MPKYRVQIATYNGNLGKGASLHNPALSAWLIPTLKHQDEQEYGHEKSSSGKVEPADLVAIGFQEMIPLHLSFVGYSRTAIDEHDEQIKLTLDSYANSSTSRSARNAQRESYTLLSKSILGGIVLLVYARDKTVTKKVVDVKIASAACGIFGVMGNKGGVGVRVVLDDDATRDTEEDEDSEEDDDSREDRGSIEEGAGGAKEKVVFTFVTAHLAAHDHGLQRRNRDYASIVSRLVFTNESISTQYRPKKLALTSGTTGNGSVGEEGKQIYETSYLFFFGDLNYRLSIKEPKALPLHIISHKIINDLEGLLKHDTLAMEQRKGFTLLGLREGAINFPPTYKYKPGTLSTFKKFTSRVPGWCDRILFSTWADGVDGAGKVMKKSKKAGGAMVEKRKKGVKVERYTSVMEFKGSDHKPVSAIIALPRHPRRSSHALRLPMSSPFSIDPLWRRKQRIGALIDYIVGIGWCFVMLVGVGRVKLGLANIFLAIMAARYLGYI